MGSQWSTMGRATEALALLVVLLLLYNVVSNNVRVSEYVPQTAWLLVEQFQGTIPFYAKWNQHVCVGIIGLTIQLLKCLASCWKYWSCGRCSPNTFRSALFWITVTCAWVAIYKLGEENKVLLVTTILIGLFTALDESLPSASPASGRIMDDVEHTARKPKRGRPKATVKPFLGDLKTFEYSTLTGRRSAPPILASEAMELDYHPEPRYTSQKMAEPVESMERANYALETQRRSSIKGLISDGISTVHKLLCTDEMAVRMGSNDVDRDSRVNINLRDPNAKSSLAKYSWLSLKGAGWLVLSFSVTYGFARCCGIV